MLLLLLLQVTIRVQKADGSPGVTMQDWLVDLGLEAPRSRNPLALMAANLDAVRRRQNSAAQRRMAQQLGSSRGPRVGGGGGPRGRGRRQRRGGTVGGGAENGGGRGKSR